MQYEFNDYKRLTRGYLRNYRTWVHAIEAWEKERIDIERELASVPVAVSKYGGEPGGGTGELNSVESLAERRIKLNKRAAAIEQDINELRRVMRNVDPALHALEDETMRIVDVHYIQGHTWMETAYAFDYSESAVKQKGYRAIGKIAEILFGRKAAQYTQTILIA